MIKLNEITTDAIMALDPCDDYSRESVEALLNRPLDTESQVVDLLLELPENDARWILSRALSVPNRVVWAKACAERARGYAPNVAGAAAHYAARNAEYAAAADAAARYARYARYANAAAARAASFSRYAADAASYAEYAARAAQYADAAAEHRLAVEHAVRLMGAL